MAINANSIVERILPRLRAKGMATEVAGEDSQTTDMIRFIVEEVVREITTNGEVIVIQLNSQGIGNMGAPVLSLIQGTGKGIIR